VLGVAVAPGLIAVAGSCLGKSTSQCNETDENHDYKREERGIDGFGLFGPYPRTITHIRTSLLGR
jgi:hypothetical protein